MLFELADGRFHVVALGVLAPVMSGPGYLLVEKPLADVLSGLPIEQVAYEAAMIHFPATGEEARSHVRIKVGQRFTHREIGDLDLSGLRLLLMNDEYCFVNEALKVELQQASFAYLEFTEGLSGFGASAA